MPVPANLNYDKWLGSTPLVYYTENRVHPQSPDIRRATTAPDGCAASSSAPA